MLRKELFVLFGRVIGEFGRVLKKNSERNMLLCIETQQSTIDDLLLKITSCG
ncbi:hypothetical protein SAMN05421780_10120 [Flexibacter flexilis DSM 6793]|uniref:Uncharacterized protein n=1 Tax=Flexibacter flexilis DSM 6793 TaxID=927664 RepID=A0A1I1DE08_9BACT|nr:hypothetical protein SAMN05421780_10120 [Flexibacter flexilis DSM 6793]